jgi:ElaB/YqjD/DUF883 family membrane-anchored ribosome-binding protein
MMAEHMSDERKPEAIKNDIDHTLSAMDRTVCELQDKMSFRGIADQVGHFFKGRAESGHHSRVPGRLADAVTDNPVPAALFGLGMAWMIMDRISPRGRHDGREVGRYDRHDWLQPGAEYTPGREGSDLGENIGRAGRRVGERLEQGFESTAERAGSAIENVKERASHFAERARHGVEDVGERLSHVGERVGHRVGAAKEQVRHLGESARVRAKEATTQVQHMYDENPLALGAAAVGIGLVAGMLIPATRREDRLMGEVRDDLVGAARDIGREAIQEGREVVKQVATTVREEVRKADTGQMNTGQMNTGQMDMDSGL